MPQSPWLVFSWEQGEFLKLKRKCFPSGHLMCTNHEAWCHERIYIQIIRMLFLLLKKKINKARLSRPPEILVLRWPALYLKSRIQCVVGFIGRPPYKSPQIPAGSESHRLAPGYVVCTCFRRYVNPLRMHPIL